MLRLKSAPFAILLLLLLTLTAGCTQSTEADRLACLNLTSYSQTSIPKCETQEKCFSLLEEKLGLRAPNLSPQVQDSLHLYKNRLALSWLYYNRAMKNLNSMHAICQSSGDFSGISTQLNELKNNLTQAFAEADSANKESFSIIFLERSALEAQGVNLVKEEPLFADYVLLNTNINELSSGTPSVSGVQPENSDSYVSIYLSRMREFENAAQGVGAGGAGTAGTFSPFDLADYLDQPLLAQIPKTSFVVPLLTNALSMLITSAAESYRLHESVSSLKGFPAFELLNTYNGIAGSENSVARKFSELINSDSAHRAELGSRNSELAQEAASLLSAASAKAAALDSSAYSSFDQNFISELYSLLGQGTGISTQHYSLSDISTARASASTELSRLNSALQEARDMKFLGRLSIGEEGDKLKAIVRDARLLSESLEFISSEAVSGLAVLCDSRIELIGEKISPEPFSADAATTAADLKARLEYRIRQYKSAKDARQKLQLCRPAVEAYSEYAAALRDFSEYSADTEEGIDACMRYLAALFSSQARDSLASYSPILRSLQTLEKPYENPQYVLDSCLGLKANAEYVLASDPQAAEFSGNYSSAKALLENLRLMSRAGQGIVDASSLLSAEKKFAELGAFFSGGKIDYSKLLPELGGANSASSQLLSSLNALLAESLENYLEKTARFEYFSSGTPELGKEYASSIRLEMKNPFAEFAGALEISPPFAGAAPLPLSDSAPLTLSYSTPNVSSASAEKGKLSVSLSSLPLGSTVLIFDSNSVPATATETTKVILVDAEKALMEKTLEIKSNSAIAELAVSLPLSGFGSRVDEGSIAVYAGGKPVESFVAGGALAFSLPIEKSETVKIYYSLLTPLSVFVSLISQTQLDANTVSYAYSITIKNLLPSSLQNAKISVPVLERGENVSAIDLRGSDGAKIAAELLPSGAIAFTVSSLPPQQGLQFTLALAVKDYASYWGSVLSAYETRLSNYASSQDAGISSAASSLLAELSSLHSSLDLKNTAQLNSILSLGTRVNALDSNAEREEAIEARYSLLLRDAGEAALAVKETISKLDELGFSQNSLAFLSALHNAEPLIAQAEALHSSGRDEEAISFLLNAKAVLSGVKVPALWESISQRKDVLLSSSSAIFTAGKKYGMDDAALRDAIAAHEQNLARAIVMEDIAGAKAELSALEKGVHDYNLALASSLMGKCASSAENAERLLLLSPLIPKKISELRKMLAQENKTVVSSYIFPITEERLQELESKLAKALPKALLQLASSLSSSLHSPNCPSALEDAEKSSAELSSALAEAERIDAELSSNLAKVREDATVIFNSVVKKFNGSGAGNTDAEALLSDAKQNLSNGNYPEAISLSNRATALLSMQPALQGIPEIPLAVYPLAAVVVIAGIFRLRAMRNAKNPPALKKLERNEE
ncbi:MAG: hypothetical protein V1676_05445 [Candidatus Diapherotrites archaeon]